MEISIVGAGGTIGRQIAIGLAHQKLLPATGRLQLVGHAGGPSEQTLPGIAADLADAFAEDIPEIDLAFSPADVLGDIIILAAGATVGPGGARSAWARTWTRCDFAGRSPRNSVCDGSACRDWFWVNMVRGWSRAGAPSACTASGRPMARRA